MKANLLSRLVGVMKPVVSLVAISVSALFANPVDAVELINPRIDEGAFEVEIQTETNLLYSLQWIPAILGTNWVTAATVLGNETLKTLRDSELTNSSRFYRVTVAPWRSTVVLEIGSTGRDAWVSRGGTGTESRAYENYGSNVLLLIGQTGTSGQFERSFILFDISSIPSNAVVESAFLTLTGVSGHAGISSTPIEGCRMLRPWVEDEVTWEQPANGSDWSDSGFRSENKAGYHSSDSLTNAPIFSGILTKIGVSTFELNTAQVQGWISGTFPNHGMLLRCPIESQGATQVHMASLEEPEISKRPTLTITYTGGTP